MPQLFGSDITLPRDPTSALQATTKQYVDTKLTEKSDTAHTHNPEDLGAISLDTLGTLFSQFFESVRTLYTVEMTPVYQWNERPIGISPSTNNAKWYSFIDCPGTCFANNGCAIVILSGVSIARYGYRESFFASSALGSTALENLASFVGVPRTVRRLHNGTLMIISHQFSSHSFDNISLDPTIVRNKNTSLTANHFYLDAVQSKSDTTKVILLGCDASGPVIYCSANLGSPSKSTYSG